MTNQANQAIIAKQISKSFISGESTIQVLKDITFMMPKGEIVMIVGPSGCGKTTLLSIIAGTLRSDSGEMTVLDSPLYSMSEQDITEFRRKNIGFIFQQFHLIKTLTCLENVSIPLLLNHIPSSEIDIRAKMLMEQVGLEGKEAVYPRFLSGGQQQRVAIARALVHSPDLIICDEPTSALDAETGISIMELLKKTVQQFNKTAVIVTHDNRIFKYADRIYRMDNGSICEQQHF